MSEIIPFEFETKEVRAITDSAGDPWWVASDICNTLGIGNVTDAVSRLDDDEKRTFDKIEGVKGGPARWIINEPGLYTLILRSNKPDAKRFKRWVTHEVIPAIRKTGMYGVNGMSELDLIIRSAQQMKQLQEKTVEHDSRIAALEAKSHQNSGWTGYWTIMAWCRLNNLTIAHDEALKKGRAASRLSKKWGVDISRVPDERFGEVNSYREDVLVEVFEMEPASAD